MEFELHGLREKRVADSKTTLLLASKFPDVHFAINFVQLQYKSFGQEVLVVDATLEMNLPVLNCG